VETETFCLELTLELAEAGIFMEAMRNIPQPSQLDDWLLYEKLETEKIRRAFGEQSMAEFTKRKEQDRLRLKQAKRALEFRSSVADPIDWEFFQLRNRAVTTLDERTRPDIRDIISRPNVKLSG
jgi:hypothetical protein